MQFIFVLEIQANVEKETLLSGNIEDDIHMRWIKIHIHLQVRESGFDRSEYAVRNFS